MSGRPHAPAQDLLRLPRRVAVALAAVAVAPWLGAQLGHAEGAHPSETAAPASRTEASAPAPRSRAPLEAARIDEHLGAPLPLDLPLHDAQGRPTRLGDVFGSGPVLLVLGYYHCPMLCGQVLEGAADALAALQRSAGAQAVPRVVAVSIDPRDDAASARRRQARVLERLGWAPERWPFLVGDAAQVRRLADAVGFGYALDPASGDYAHAAVMTVATSGGAIAGYLYGIRFDPDALGDLLQVAQAGGSRGSLHPVLLRCLQYVPALRRHAEAIGWFLRGGALLVIAVLALWLAQLWRAELRREAS